jgi:hypothetical protein
MTAITMGTEKDSPNYTAIGEQLSSGRELDNESIGVLMSIGLEYASGLIKVKNPVGLDQKADEIKNFLTEIVLGRINSLYIHAVKFRMEKAESITFFGDLRDAVCEKLSLPKESLPENLLSDLLTRGLDPLYDIDPSPVVRDQLVWIRKTASDIIPNNPASTAGTEVSNWIN